MLGRDKNGDKESRQASPAAFHEAVGTLPRKDCPNTRKLDVGLVQLTN